MTSLNTLLQTNPTSLLGHRGARGERFENSKEGFEFIQNLATHSEGKLVGIEFDVQLTKDGELIVFHDEDLTRLFNRQSRIDQLSAEEIQRICHIPINVSYKSFEFFNNSQRSSNSKPELFNQSVQHVYPYKKHSIMLLKHMPKMLQGYSHIELEVKTHCRTDYAKMVDSLKSCLLDQIFKDLPIILTSFDVALHQHLQHDVELSLYRRGLLVEPASSNLTEELFKNSLQVCSGIISPNNNTITLNENCLMSTGQAFSNTISLALRLGCTSIGLFYPIFNENFIGECHKYGLTTTAWTVNNVEYAKTLVQLGVDYLITDYPSIFLRS
ncbi:glycerophosphodiester phosphodiesterase [Psychrobacter sp.]|uniref:glycerophosphodiester phosphodiesterase n=1 Tax=Psychrobacter sp. TaxID=56811 RepID=UPI0025EC9D37|nr:glycerophosphodiester phosphodiesterase [Psychrobacter sp.]